MSQTYYFNPCCQGIDPFGIPNNSRPFVSFPGFIDTVGTQYLVTISGSNGNIIFSGCVQYSGVTLNNTTLPNVGIYNGSPTFSSYDCDFCLQYISPCYTPPITPNPTIIGYKNECGIITILPMTIECEVSQPTTPSSFDGEVSVSISGGTAPYITTWVWGDNNTSESPAIGEVGNGSYTATTVDYWGDFTATTVCTLNVAPDCSFNVTIVEQDIENCLPTAMSGYTFDLT